MPILRALLILGVYDIFFSSYFANSSSSETSFLSLNEAEGDKEIVVLIFPWRLSSQQ